MANLRTKTRLYAGIVAFGIISWKHPCHFKSIEQQMTQVNEENEMKNVKINYFEKVSASSHRLPEYQQLWEILLTEYVTVRYEGPPPYVGVGFSAHSEQG